MLGGEANQGKEPASQCLSEQMSRFPIPTVLLCLAVLAWSLTAPSSGRSISMSDLKQSQTGAAPGQDAAAEARLTRGKKLVLKDGSFQLVRSYERNGDRVRYYSMERGTWEEIPASLVDWDATAKVDAETAKADEALLSKVHTQEEATKVETTLDVDASLQIAPGVFLPPGEGMFVIQGRSVTPLAQVGSEVKTDKKTVLKQILSPIPIVPSKHNVEIPGAKAALRVNSEAPEFYLREAPPDPERDAPVQRSSRPGEYGPEVELVRATVKGNKRQLESIRNLFGQEIAQDRNSVSIQRWEVARTVYRFTLSAPLQPGEYALAEILPDGMSLYVWDFGVDARAAAKPAQH
jgi:hypothetical protein